jgi:hypothetical protein
LLWVRVVLAAAAARWIAESFDTRQANRLIGDGSRAAGRMHSCRFTDQSPHTALHVIRWSAARMATVGRLDAADRAAGIGGDVNVSYATPNKPVNDDTDSGCADRSCDGSKHRCSHSHTGGASASPSSHREKHPHSPRRGRRKIPVTTERDEYINMLANQLVKEKSVPLVLRYFDGERPIQPSILPWMRSKQHAPPLAATSSRFHFPLSLNP